MSLLAKVKTLWQPADVAPGGNHVYVVDPAYTASGNDKKGRGRLNPGAQVKALQKISRFAKREALTLMAVFEGHELRVVSHKGDFHGVQVFFEPEQDAFHRAALGVARDAMKNGAVTVITNDAELVDKVRGAGGQAMRYETLKKALENGSERSAPTGTRSSRPPRGRKPRRRADEEIVRGSRQGGSDTSRVREMLDLVD